MEMSTREKVSTVNGLVPYAAILFFVEFVRGAYLVSFLPAFAAEHLGYTASVVGLAVSAHYFSDSVLKVFVGYLLDRLSMRFILQFGLLVSLIGLWAMPYLHSPALFIAAAAVVGIGGSPVWLVCMTQVQEENRAAQTGLLYTVWLAGLGLGPVVINFLMDVSYSSSFWFLLLIWILGWGLSMSLHPVRPIQSTAVSARAQVKLLGQRLVRMGPILPGMIMQTLAAGMLVPILSDFATNRLGLSHAEYSTVLITGGACTALCLIPMGRLADLNGRKWFLVIGFAFFSIALYGLTIADTFGMTLGLAAVLGASYAAVLPAWNALLARFVPQEQQGMGWGIFSSVEGIGVVIGPIIGGWLAVKYSVELTICFSALLLAAIALIYIFFPASRFGEGSHGKEKRFLQNEK